MEKILEIKDLRKNYMLGEVELQVIRGISFEIFEGEFAVILGPSGSGKSTILNILGGIDQMSGGQMFFREKPLHDANDAKLTDYRRNNIGFVFQFYNLIPNLTAKENIETASELSVNPIPSGELLEQVGLADHADYFPSKMSGGQQQRIAIARAIAKNPDLLLCDEPTGALDVKTGAQVLELLLDFNEKYKKTVIVVTHNAAIAKIGSRTFYIKDGLLDKVEANLNPLRPSEVIW